MSRLGGKVAIVTGAGTGLGRATACLYAAEGAKVAVGDIRHGDGVATVGAIKAAGGEALFVPTDVSNEADVRGLIDATVAAFGALHIMTANAGIIGREAGKNLEETSLEDFDRVMGVNFGGVLYAFKFAIPRILESGGGAMTATSSLAAHRGFGKLPAYCASKGAVNALVRSVAAEFAPRIRVNAVSAGNMATELRQHTAEERGEEIDFASVRPAGESFGGRAEASEVAAAHLFLVSGEASFITGQALHVDGGRSIVPA